MIPTTEGKFLSIVLAKSDQSPARNEIFSGPRQAFNFFPTEVMFELTQNVPEKVRSLFMVFIIFHQHSCLFARFFGQWSWTDILARK